MLRLRWLVLGIAVAGFSACGSVGAKKLLSHYDPNESAWSRSLGHNTIIGTAASGRIDSKGGDPVELFPVTPYTSELMSYAYGNTTGGAELRDIAPAISPALRANDIKTEYCNARGSFTFANLPDGEYFVVATVAWKEFGINHRNKHLMRRVAVSGDMTAEVAIVE